MRVKIQPLRTRRSLTSWRAGTWGFKILQQYVAVKRYIIPCQKIGELGRGTAFL